MIYRRSIPAVGIALLFTMPLIGGQTTPEQEAYWWQDEIRTVAFDVARMKDGAVRQWPRMTRSAGTITMPLPMVSGRIVADGKLDEPQWQKATRFLVGPVFADWRTGPLLLNVSACRDAQTLFLAVESSVDLTSLGALTPAGELLTVGQQPIVAKGHVIEVTVPFKKEAMLRFPVELARRVQGELPDAFTSLGLNRLATAGTSRDFRKPWLWLEPITVRLVPSDISVRASYEFSGIDGIRLTHEVQRPHRPIESFIVALQPVGETSILSYSVKPVKEKPEFVADGFFYVEPTLNVVDDARSILDRVATDYAGHVDLERLRTEIAELRHQANATAPNNRLVWRDTFCRARELRALAHLAQLDAPLLFVKRHPYFAGHIYDDYYTWRPGGGIYVSEQPQTPSKRSVRALIDPDSKETLGTGIYRDPEVDWSAKRVLFAFKGDEGNTSIYEIGVDGTGLNRLSDPSCGCTHQPEDATHFQGQHDVTPTYLPDGRIAFTSTRPGALVPCFNSRVDTLHIMDADGENVHSISSNNVNEFDPTVMPDGRILYGRWEYVDKTALYMQSLWTMRTDGTMEEALFANNLARPTAVLDARPVPNAHAVVASLTPHNGQAVGAIGMIDTTQGKNDLNAVFNFTPEYPIEMDQGLRTGPCDPWPLSENDVLVSNNAIGGHAFIELIDRWGHRELVHCEPDLSCYAPMLIKPRRKPTNVSPVQPNGKTGRFLVVDIYQGLTGVKRGSIKRLRVVEETARISGLPPGGRWWNQAFLVSWQGAYIVKNFLGTVPVHPDGSAYFEVPSGRAIYFEALDESGREIQRMRTFVQAVPGTTRSCIGCHENKKTATVRSNHLPLAMRLDPARPEPESWGSGYIDYPTMIQPIMDRYCVSCHGGEKDIAQGIDLSGGWTWAFNIGYETLIKNRLTGFLNCHNSSVHTSQVLAPGVVGSGSAKLADLLIQGHGELPRRERDLILAWMDTNSNYFGTWDYTPNATCNAILAVQQPLTSIMQAGGCTQCHQPGHIGNDWINLQTPEWSRILRAPMAKNDGGLGLAMCRDRKARTGYPLVTQRIQPPDIIKESLQPEWTDKGTPHVSWQSTGNDQYQAMLAVIRRARAEALARPRVDMPGAEIVGGACRRQIPMDLPEQSPAMTATLRRDAAVVLTWPRYADTVGLSYSIHRDAALNFKPNAKNKLTVTTGGQFVDLLPPVGKQYYALVVTSDDGDSRPSFTSIVVPRPEPPAPPTDIRAEPMPGEVTLTWQGETVPGIQYLIYRRLAGETENGRLNAEPLRAFSFNDTTVMSDRSYTYFVTAIDRRGHESAPSNTLTCKPLPLIREPVFETDFSRRIEARLLSGKAVLGKANAGARPVTGVLEFGSTGFVTFTHRPEFDIRKAFTFECWVRMDRQSQMPVVAACGAFNSSGWFLQRYGRGWRWHVAPASCDGGIPVIGKWTHLVGTFDGRKASLYQDGKRVASVACPNGASNWQRELVLGQYTNRSPSYQVQGGVSGVKIYQRALSAVEITERFQLGRNAP